MDIIVLKIFQVTAQEGSVSKAAERLYYVQSNVTTRIRQLESEIGKPLFIRHYRGLTLTDTGKVLLGYAEKILYFQRVQTPLQFWKVPGEEKHDESPLPSLPHEGGGEGKV